MPVYVNDHAPVTSDAILAELRGTFGHRDFRDEQQRSIVHQVLQERPDGDVFVQRRTGGGKSLCYQLAAQLSSGVTIVVTPLLVLMEDQVRALIDRDVVAVQYKGGLRGADREIHLDMLREGYVTLLYVTPEGLCLDEKLRAVLKELAEKGKVARLVMDEAHCVSMWGHTFRPEYAKVGGARQKLFPDVGITALTGTATKKTRDDIMQVLGMKDVFTSIGSTLRANLHIAAV
eukprot:9469106-Pyramimonas_sp.AAC.1